MVLKFGLVCLTLVLGIVRAEDGNTDIIYAKLRKEVELECPDSTDSWKKKYNATVADFTDIVAGDDVEVEGGKLVLKRLQEEELGVYACLDDLGDVLKQFEVALAFRMRKLPQSVSVDVGSSTEDTIKCVVIGERPVIFRWFTRPEDSEEGSEHTAICGVDNDHCPSEEGSGLSGFPEVEESKKKSGAAETTTAKPLKDRISIEEGRDEDDNQYSTIKIANSQLEDRAVYICHGIAAESESEDGYECEDTMFCEESETILRVKDPLAAIWPFAGIVLEVVVLCLVIFICERRKKAEDKEDMDEDGYAGNNVSNNSLRQRK